MIPQEVRALAAGIADDIERNGHYRGYPQTPYSSTRPDGPCCLVVSPSSYKVGIDMWHDLIELIPVEDPIFWNDHAPTDEVVGTLRKIAAGEQP